MWTIATAQTLVVTGMWTIATAQTLVVTGMWTAFKTHTVVPIGLEDVRMTGPALYTESTLHDAENTILQPPYSNTMGKGRTMQRMI